MSVADKALPVDREALGKWLFDNRDNLRYTQDWADLTPSTQKMWRQKADALIASSVLRALAAAVWDEALTVHADAYHPTLRYDVGNPYREQAPELLPGTMDALNRLTIRPEVGK